MNSEEKYVPKSYLTVEMIKEVMEEFDWPSQYEVFEDDEMVNTFIVKFLACEIELYDVPEDGINLTFLTYGFGKKLDAEYLEVVYLECIDNYNPEKDIDAEYNSYTDRVDDTRRMVRNKMKNLQYYHLGFIKGDNHDWVNKFLDKKNIL
ncbi:hypothetical protein [uncultured Tenacibaculum sp.]|uniref:hypothetical protein n=1 Tax=uncultured Tenacibaculum sp. TaxID=174713 RepID=UPI00261CB4B9|nr:hypothetical protein [uncultured Tenacibaculum sp.]